jgi:hypothetical protein
LLFELQPSLWCSSPAGEQPVMIVAWGREQLYFIVCRVFGAISMDVAVSPALVSKAPEREGFINVQRIYR